MTTYVGLAVADSMFPETCFVTRRPISVPALLKMLEHSIDEPVVNCCNASHKASLDALRQRFGIDLVSTIQEKPPQVALEPRDIMVILGIRGLPRLTDRHEYTEAEVARATFSFGVWEVGE